MTKPRTGTWGWAAEDQWCCMTSPTRPQLSGWWVATEMTATLNFALTVWLYQKEKTNKARAIFRAEDTVVQYEQFRGRLNWGLPKKRFNEYIFIQLKYSLLKNNNKEIRVNCNCSWKCRTAGHCVQALKCFEKPEYTMQTHTASADVALLVCFPEVLTTNKRRPPWIFNGSNTIGCVLKMLILHTFILLFCWCSLHCIPASQEVGWGNNSEGAFVRKTLTFQEQRGPKIGLNATTCNYWLVYMTNLWSFTMHGTQWNVLTSAVKASVCETPIIQTAEIPSALKMNLQSIFDNTAYAGEIWKP